MTNGEMYKSTEERSFAFREWCNANASGCTTCKYMGRDCKFEWLTLEAKNERAKRSKLKNGEKFKTPEARARAFMVYCSEKSCHASAAECNACHFRWLDSEETEKPLPCPFCGRPVVIDRIGTKYNVGCDLCEYVAKAYDTKEEAIAEHNRIARTVIDDKNKEAK